jgi:hypothetical protein
MTIFWVVVVTFREEYFQFLQEFANDGHLMEKHCSLVKIGRSVVNHFFCDWEDINRQD